jgi:SAM-dependent methyltransferase
MSDDYEYIGDELKLFSAARNWKATLRRQLQPFIGGDVLEVGAGIGATMNALRGGEESSWTCVEPDRRLADELEASLPGSRWQDAPPSMHIGTTADLPPQPAYDTVLYVDVIEHIEDDREEVQRAAGLLRSGGYLVILAPAHQFLFTPFDESIGHFRRYDRRMMQELDPAGTRLVRLWYLDSVGFLASLANRLMLQSAMPTARQLWVWDTFMVPPSRLLDPLLLHRFGKSVFGVWQKLPDA